MAGTCVCVWLCAHRALNLDKGQGHLRLPLVRLVEDEVDERVAQLGRLALKSVREVVCRRKPGGGGGRAVAVCCRMCVCVVVVAPGVQVAA
jgi:hypothetical protein